MELGSLRRWPARIGVSLAALAVLPAASPAGETDRADALERRVEELERVVADGGTRGGWSERIALSGSVNTGYYWGEEGSVFDPHGFKIWDARFFVDAELGENVTLGSLDLVRNVGMTFEWDLVRLGQLQNGVGELYVDFQGIAQSDWLSIQVGRFQVPVGEAYLRYSKGYRDKPFVSNPVGGPWWWDEGLRFYGNGLGGWLGYVASVSDGTTGFNTEDSPAKQFTLKLYTDPLPWLHLSVSGLRSGSLGTSSQPANGAVWLGETWARGIGSNFGPPPPQSFDHGVAVPPGPSVLDGSALVTADAIVDLSGRFRLWLGYGWHQIDSSGGNLYDRELHYWIAELLLYGGLLSPELDDVYLGLRANAIGTYDDNRGYLLDSRYAESLGYNMESLTHYSIVIGWELLPRVKLRTEYTLQDIELVDGVPANPGPAAGRVHQVAVEVGVDF